MDLVGMIDRVATDWAAVMDVKWAVQWLVNEYGLRSVRVKDVVAVMDNPPRKDARRIVELGVEDYNSEFGPKVRLKG